MVTVGFHKEYRNMGGVGSSAVYYSFGRRG